MLAPRNFGGPPIFIGSGSLKSGIFFRFFYAFTVGYSDWHRDRINEKWDFILLKIKRVQVLEMTVQFDFFFGLLDGFHGRDHPLEMLN